MIFLFYYFNATPKVKNCKQAAHFAKRNTKFGGGGKARAGKNSFPPTPFLFARPSVQFGARSAPSVPFKKGSD
ncbi:MAG: hypothetical protein Q8P01_06030, partial [bacterium]|nr:hypothetical protein [bacterium]